MRFQISEIVDSPDAELVSRTLETSLRAQWSDVAREGNTIVLRGLGPTHRVNRNDKTVFEVKPAEGGRTAIEAEVTYQASALVGTTAPQNELVQRKLDGVLELVRMDIDLAQRRAAQEGERGQKPWLVNKNAATTTVVAETEVEAATVESPEVERELTGTAVGHSYAWENSPPKMNGGALREAWQLVAPEIVATPVLPVADVSEAKRVEASVVTPVVSEAPAMKPSQPAPVEQRLVHRGEDLANEERNDPRPATDRSIGKIFATLLVVFVLAGAAQVGWQYRPQLSQGMSQWRAGLSGTSQDGNAGPTPEQKAAEQQAAREAAAADAETAIVAAKLAEPDPKKWLENWADAMRGQDAGTQAAFYADTVDKYFLKRDVSRADVMTSRQASIEKRTGNLTMRLDNVVVAEQTDTTATILLVKYIATDGPTGIVEQRLPTQIKLKRIDGQWRIVSEQTLG